MMGFRSAAGLAVAAGGVAVPGSGDHGMLAARRDVTGAEGAAAVQVLPSDGSLSAAAADDADVVRELDALDVEFDVEEVAVPAPGVSADAMPGVPATAVPTPNAIASPPT